MCGDKVFEAIKFIEMTFGQKVLLLILPPQGGPTGLFDINQESGQIYLRRNLVDSDIGALHSLTVVATDGGSPTQTGEAEVIVRVFNCTLQTHRWALVRSCKIWYSLFPEPSS